MKIVEKNLLDEPVVCFCKLDTGEIVPYDAVSETADAYGDEYRDAYGPAYVHIGAGVVYSVDGVIQDPKYNTRLHFFVRRDK